MIGFPMTFPWWQPLTGVDSTGAAIWIGDTVISPAASDPSPVVALEHQVNGAEVNVVVSVGALQFVFAGSRVTVAARASEQPLTADQVATRLVE